MICGWTFKENYNATKELLIKTKPKTIKLTSTAATYGWRQVSLGDLKIGEEIFQSWYDPVKMNEQMEFVKKIAGLLDSAAIPYMLTGSMALALYTRPRMTRDIDLVIECQSPDFETIVRLFEVDCYVDAQEVRDAIASRTMFNIIHNGMSYVFYCQGVSPCRNFHWRSHVRSRSTVLGVPQTLRSGFRSG